MRVPGSPFDIPGPPSTDEARAALDRVLANEIFRGSPQLAAFLRYVVDATLRGEAGRIKGYTIAVEALGRDAAFDPQADPIVRVEAARLRRALRRYYASAGRNETVRFDLPIGSYVPVFRRVRAAPAEPGVPVARRLDWRRIARGAGLIVAGAAMYALLDFWFPFSIPHRNVKPVLAAPERCPPCPPVGAVPRDGD